MRVAGLLASMALALAACSVISDGEPDVSLARLSCGGAHAFDQEVLAEPGNAELGDDPAAIALRTHLVEGGMEADSLPDAGWIEASRAGGEVFYVAHGDDGALHFATVETTGDRVRVTSWGGCDPRPDLPSGVNIAHFRIAPGVELDATTTQIEVLVTERECNSGEDARGRILPPLIINAPDTVTVLMTVRARGGTQGCPSNPETPFLLELPEPLGDRALLDGSTVPPRDAATCPDAAMCP